MLGAILATVMEVQYLTTVVTVVTIRSMWFDRVYYWSKRL